MNARFLTTATLLSVSFAALPALAADPQLLNLVMPDAKVLAGVNVDQAKTSPFGQYVIGQINAQQDANLQQLIALTGFDPTRDVHEIVAAVGSGQHSGMVAARGSFDAKRITTLALAHSEVTTETYKDVTIIEDKKQTGGVAFLSATYAVAGDLASVKGAIDQLKVAAPLPGAVTALVNQWSANQDAWALTTVPPASLHPAGSMPPIPGVGPGNQGNAFQGISQAAGGVKFGNTNVVVTAQATAATADDAKQMGDALKLLASLAQLQSNADPNLIALVKSLTVTTSGSVLTATVSLPQDMLMKIVQTGTTKAPATNRHTTPRKN